MTRSAGWRGMRPAVLALVVPALLLGSTSVAYGRGVRGSEVGSWTLATTAVEPHAYTDQGVATVAHRNGSVTVLTRGDASIPAALRARGWVHIGDPDSRGGYVIDAFQGTVAASAKLFVITAPNGARTYLSHPLVPGESFHNSFAAFSPDRRWFVAGEWGVMHRLLVFAVPGKVASSPAHPVTLRLASTVRLSRPVGAVQGCVFGSATRLLCSSSDASGALFPATDPLLAVHLDHPVGSHQVRGAVSLIGALPQDPTCSVVGEAEGIDLHGSTLTVSVNSRCRAATLINTMHPDGA